MAAAGRNSHKHVAAEPCERITNHDEKLTPRHKAVRRRQVARLAGPAVFALSVAGTLVALEAGDPGTDLKPTPAAIAPLDLSVRTGQVSRSISRAVSRSAIRPLATAERVVLQPTAVDHKWTTTAVTLRTSANPHGRGAATVARATRLGVTGQTFRGWSEVLVEREVPAERRSGKRSATRTVTVARWVNSEYLVDHKPAPPKPEPEPAEPEAETTSEPESTDSSESATATTGVSGDYCPDGSSVESGLTSSAVRLYRAVCAAFPALTTYGGYDPHGEHVDGRAIDFMITDSSLGQAVADYVLANASALGVRDIIWSQHIWTPEQAASGWRPMEDRGSPTANHYDHVHVAVY